MKKFFIKVYMYFAIFSVVLLGIVVVASFTTDSDTTTYQVANDKARTIARYGQPWVKQKGYFEKWIYKHQLGGYVRFTFTPNGWLVGDSEYAEHLNIVP